MASTNISRALICGSHQTCPISSRFLRCRKRFQLSNCCWTHVHVIQYIIRIYNFKYNYCIIIIFILEVSIYKYYRDIIHGYTIQYIYNMYIYISIYLLYIYIYTYYHNVIIYRYISKHPFRRAGDHLCITSIECPASWSHWMGSHLTMEFQSLIEHLLWQRMLMLYHVLLTLEYAQHALHLIIEYLWSPLLVPRCGTKT